VACTVCTWWWCWRCCFSGLYSPATVTIAVAILVRICIVQMPSLNRVTPSFWLFIPTLHLYWLCFHVDLPISIADFQPMYSYTVHKSVGEKFRAHCCCPSWGQCNWLRTGCKCACHQWEYRRGFRGGFPVWYFPGRCWKRQVILDILDDLDVTLFNFEASHDMPQAIVPDYVECFP